MPAPDSNGEEGSRTVTVFQMGFAWPDMGLQVGSTGW